MTLKVLEIGGFTYRTATNLICGCEDDAAIPNLGEKSNEEIHGEPAVVKVSIHLPRRDQRVAWFAGLME